MKLLDLTLGTPAANLALDEALLDLVETSPDGGELLRFWELPEPAVVVGRASRVAEEVELDYCRSQNIPILRRCSGGAAVVLGPGCFVFSVILRYDLRPGVRLIDDVHRLVLGQTAVALRKLGVDARMCGTSDLALGDRKISGNSVRCRRNAFLYHGTVLCAFPLELIAKCLRTPPRQPDYRRGRQHGEFVSNVSLESSELRDALRTQWEANTVLIDWPRERTQQLLEERYLNDTWNLQR